MSLFRLLYKTYKRDFSILPDLPNQIKVSIFYKLFDFVNKVNPLGHYKSVNLSTDIFSFQIQKLCLNKQKTYVKFFQGYCNNNLLIYIDNLHKGIMLCGLSIKLEYHGLRIFYSITDVPYYFCKRSVLDHIHRHHRTLHRPVNHKFK